MSSKFITAGVIGWPVSHSRSPIIHNHWVHQYGLAGCYGLFPVAPGNLEKALQGIRALGIAGCNITIPYKIEAMKFMDWIDPLAERIGAINTVVVQANGELHGFNTDGFGYVQSLRDANPQWRADLGPVVIVGAGGAARSIIVSMINEGARDIRIINRTMSKAQDLAEEFGNTVNAVDWADRHNVLNDAALLTNTTSQGMVNEPALDLNIRQLPKSALVSDVIYAPLETPLLTQAKKQGNTTVNGLGMLIHQARPAFHAWFGVMPDCAQELNQKIINTF